MRASKLADLSNTILRIQSVYASLTKSEQKVADAVLKDPEAAMFNTITDLSEKAEVGDTSVIRFCRKLGFRGYQEFKLSIAQHLATPSEHMLGDIDEEDGLETLIKKISAINTQLIENTTALLNGRDLQRAIDAIIQARTVYFFGVGSSGITAADAKYRFMRLGFNVVSEADAHIIAMNAALAGPEDTVVCISTSGSTKDLVDAVRIAKENGARIISITSHARSPITQQSDIVLLTTTKETPLQGGSYSTKLSQINVLDILSTVIALQRKERSRQALEKTAKSVLDKLY